MWSPSWEQIEGSLARHRPRRIERDSAERAAVAMILRDDGRRRKLLFIERAEHPRDPWSGHMAFPGGRWDSRDVDLRATAIRETAEELGLDLGRIGRFLGGLDEIEASARPRGHDLVIAPYVFRLDGPASLSLSSEVRAAYWLALAELDFEANRATIERTFEGRRLSCPCLQVDGHVVWGLTYRMYRSLEEVVQVPGRIHGAASDDEVAP